MDAPLRDIVNAFGDGDGPAELAIARQILAGNQTGQQEVIA